MSLGSRRAKVSASEVLETYMCVFCQVKVDSMASAYQPRRHSLRPQSTVDIARLLAARDDICNVVKTSSGSSRENTACAVNKVKNASSPQPVNYPTNPWRFPLNTSIFSSFSSAGPDGESPRPRRTSLRDTSSTS